MNRTVRHTRTGTVRCMGSASCPEQDRPSARTCKARYAGSPVCPNLQGMVRSQTGLDGTARMPCRAGSRADSVVRTARALCYVGSGGRTILFRAIGTACASSGGRTVQFVADGMARTAPRTMPCGFMHTYDLVGDGQDNMLSVPCGCGRTVQLGADGITRALCYAGSGGQIVQFEVDGTVLVFADERSY